MLNKSSSKTFLRQTKILPEIGKRTNYRQDYGGAEPVLEVQEEHKQVSHFTMPIREEIQMVYNTQDGSTQVIKDLSQAPKPKGDYI